MSDADLIKAILRKIRKRQFCLLWLDSSIIAILAFLFSILFYRLRFVALPRVSESIQFAAIAIFLFAALIVAIVRMPSWKESVKLVDRTLELQQRLETCWENLPPRDEIDSLLLADVSKRIRQIRPAPIAPMRMSRTSVLCIFILLPAIALLGVFRVILDWNQSSSLAKQNAAGRAVSGSSPAKKGSPKGQENKRSSDLKSQNAIATESNSEKRQTAKKEENRPSPNIPEQFGIRESKELSNSTPDSNVAVKKNDPANAAATNKDMMQPNAGVASVRKAEKGGGAPASARLSRDQKDAGKALAAGQGKSTLPGNNALFRSEYMQNHPAVWSAVEQALAKENIPPGMKKYIIDYFNAIH
jgi:hypothetical protein